MGTYVPIFIDMRKGFSVYFQLFMIFGYKTLKDSEQSHLHGQRLPTIRDQATRDPGRRGVSATLYTPHTPASLCQDTPFRHLQSHPQAKSLAQVCA